jgi:hypothetical protein
MTVYTKIDDIDRLPIGTWVYTSNGIALGIIEKGYQLNTGRKNEQDPMMKRSLYESAKHYGACIMENKKV